MRSRYIQYYVEGEDDKKVVDTLKTKMGLVKPGKVQVLNVVRDEITNVRLRTLLPDTTVVLVFDIDAGKPEILATNIQRLKECKSVVDIITIPQVPNLEGELVRSCNIKKIEELLNSKSKSDFKHDVIHVSNLESKLREHKFDINQFWTGTPQKPYQSVPNQAARIKQRSKKI